MEICETRTDKENDNSSSDLSKRSSRILLFAILALSLCLQVLNIDKMESELDDEYIVTSSFLIYEGYRPFFGAGYAMTSIWLYSIPLNVGMIIPNLGELKESIVARRMKDSLKLISQSRSSFFLNIVKIHNKLRLINALAIVGAVLFVYLVAFRLTESRLCGIFSSLFFGISPMTVNWGTDFHPDQFMTFFGTGCIYYCLGHILKKGDKQWVAASIFAGLACASKINAVLFWIPLTASVFFGSKDISPKKRILSLFYCTTIMFVTVVAIFPFLLNDPAQFVKNILLASAIIKGDSSGWANSGVIVILKYIFINCGFVFSLLAVAGASTIFFKRSTSLILILISILSLMLVYLQNSGLMERYALAFLPFVCVLASVAINYLPKKMKYRNAAMTLVLLIALIQPALQTRKVMAVRSNGDTRTLARNWVYSNVPSGSKIILTHYGPLINFNRKSVEFWKSYFGNRLTINRNSVSPVEFLRDTFLSEEKHYYKKFCYLSENEKLNEPAYDVVELWYAPNDKALSMGNDEFWVVGIICPNTFHLFDKGDGAWVVEAIKERGKLVAEFPNTDMMGAGLYIYHVEARQPAEIPIRDQAE